MYIVYIDIFNYWKLSWALEEQDPSKKKCPLGLNTSENKI